MSSPSPARGPAASVPGPSGNTLIRTFFAWTFVRAIFHNGWWLLASLFMVANAGLSAPQLLVIASAQGIASLVFEVPAGVLGDTLSRKWAIVVSHALMGTAMITTGLFPSFVPLMLSQMLWGIAWTFSSGSDVAWITDELNEPSRIDRVLTRQARWQLAGAGAGLILFGAVGAAVGRQAGIVAAGIAMLILGVFVALRFLERNFTPIRSNRWRGSVAIIRKGSRLTIHDRTILTLVVVTLLVNGAADSFARIYPIKLVNVGLPAGSDGTVWFAGISLAGFITGAVALRVIESRVRGEAGARGSIVLGCIAGALSLALFAFAPSLTFAIDAVLVANGVAAPILRTVTTIWVNRRTPSDVRATMHSFLAQAEYVGEIATAGILAAFAGIAGSSGAFILTGTLFIASAVIVLAAGRKSQRPGTPNATNTATGPQPTATALKPSESPD